MTIPTTDSDRVRTRLIVSQAMEARRLAKPFDCYKPSYPGMVKADGTKHGPWANQLGFHQARHTIRLMVPGNGWGKSTAAGAECMAWGMHTNTWQTTPSWPIVAVWFVKQRDQFDLQRVALQESVFGDLPFRDNRFIFPDGGFLMMAWADDQSQWKKYQGIPADLVVFDELPPWPLVKEMLFRRRAKRQTRFIFAMTDTEGDTWVETKLYQPWVEHHAKAGQNAEQALTVQSHPTTWVWDRGGVTDNPAATDSDRAWYESIPVSSEGERRSRLAGGFFSRVAGGVFDAGAMAWMELQNAKVKPIATIRGLHTVPYPLDSSTPQQLRKCQVQPTDITMRTGRLAVWKPPIAGHQYAAGSDHSYGVGRNEDYLAVYDITARHHAPHAIEQVAELAGNQFGPDFHRYVYAMLRWYNDAFLVGERQVGAFTLHALWHNYGYTHLYRQRTEANAAVVEQGNALLGWHRAADDLVLTTFRQTVMARRVIVRSPFILSQMRRLHYAPPNEHAPALDDYRLKLKLRNRQPDDESPDGVMAAGYGVFAATEFEHFVQQPASYPVGTWGHAAGMTPPRTSGEGPVVGWIPT